jgi:hypothetical protein
VGEYLSFAELPTHLQEYISPSASGISFYQRPVFTSTFEYSISEEDFLAWALKMQIPLTPITKPTRIFRYSSYLISYPKNDDPNALEIYERKRMATIDKGYQYEIRQSNGGGSYIVFDSVNKKAYHHYPRR